MLDLTVAMLRELSVLLVFILQSEGPLAISSPVSGATLQGIVAVTGTTDVEGFSASELTFAYNDDPTQTWFLIQSSDQPISESQIATWDTTSITDGDYKLRLRVILQDGSYQEFTVVDLHIRNSSPTPTDTPSAPTAMVSTASPIPEFTPTVLAVTSTLIPSEVVQVNNPSPYPVNPASLSESSVVTFLQRGALVALVAFAVIGLFLYLRRS